MMMMLDAGEDKNGCWLNIVEDASDDDEGGIYV